MISGCLEGPENQALEHFHDHRGQSDRSVVVQACYAGLLGNRHYGGGLEASRDVALEPAPQTQTATAHLQTT